MIDNELCAWSSSCNFDYIHRANECAGRSQAAFDGRARETREKIIKKIHFCIWYEAEAKMQKRFIVPCFANRFPTRKSRLAKLSYVHTEKAFIERRKHLAMRRQPLDGSIERSSTDRLHFVFEPLGVEITKRGNVKSAVKKWQKQRERKKN